MTRDASAPQPMKRLLVGEVARAVGVSVQTLHYYEREGVIPPPARTASGYRQFDADVIERVRFIRKAQALGLPLDEIKHVLSLAARGTSPCGRVQAALAEKLADVDRRLAELQSFRDELAHLTERAQRSAATGDAAQICAIVESSAPMTPLRPDGLRSRPVIRQRHR